MLYNLLRKIGWLILAVTSVCIGLDAVGVNIEALLHLDNIDQILRYTVGCVGAGSLVMFFVERSLGQCCKN